MEKSRDAARCVINEVELQYEAQDGELPLAELPLTQPGCYIPDIPQG